MRHPVQAVREPDGITSFADYHTASLAWTVLKVKVLGSPVAARSTD
jgi:hypothetical protein